MEYEIVIGLEVHAELKTNSKCFCSCENSFGGEPNTHCCPVCIGLPGALPVLNKEAVKKTIMAGLAMGCDINDQAVFERKNYFYPDLSKAYQISQLVKPICLGGGIETEEGFVRLNRIHLEEDAGKLIHENAVSLIDYNRGGVPLIEMVTEPDIHSKSQAIEFLNKLRNRLIYAGIAECKMEEGGMRCDVNISVRPKGSLKFGTRTEMKNLNSFKSVERAIDYESNRQIEVLLGGGVIKQQTRRWDDSIGESFAMRDKEESQDYRYFPDPDLVTVNISRELVNNLKETMPLMPEERKQKYMETYNLPEYDANVLIADKTMSDYFDECVNLGATPKSVSNFIMTEIMSIIKSENDSNIKISPENLVTILKHIDSKKITRTIGKELFIEIWENGGDANELIKSKGLSEGVSDETLRVIAETIIKNNEKAKEDYKTTPDKVLRFFIGQVMKETKGKANPEKVTEIFNTLLKE